MIKLSIELMKVVSKLGTNNILGKRIIQLRESKKWSQRELSKRVGLNASVMNRIELGERPVKDEELEKLATVLDTNADYLLGRTTNPNPPMEVHDNFDTMYEINILLKKFGITDSGFFDIEKWKAMGPDGIKQLESYFQFIVQEAERQKEEKDQNDSFKK